MSAACRCNPTKGESCRSCDGTDPRITDAEDRRDHAHPDPDAWQAGHRRYERQLWGQS